MRLELPVLDGQLGEEAVWLESPCSASRTRDSVFGVGRLVARRERFGAIVGRVDSYGFTVVNRSAFQLISAVSQTSAAQIQAQSPDNQTVAAFLDKIENLGWLDSDGHFAGRIVDNRNDVPFMSAPIRVWLEVTSRCNLKCNQCFNQSHQEHLSPDLPLPIVLAMLEDLHRSGVLQLTVTGGEPLIRRDIFLILDRISELGFGLRFFTNGTSLTERTAARLGEYPISHLFLSLDGIGHLNDILRGGATYARIVRGLSLLSARGRQVTLSTTLHSLSTDGIADLFHLAAQHGVRSILIRPLFQYHERETDRSIPPSLIDTFLDSLENASARYGIEYQVNKLPFRPLSKSVFAFDHPADVHFSYFNSHNRFGCVGGNTVVGIKSNGVIMACGFVPHKYATAGHSLLERPFLDLWNSSENVTVLRDLPGNSTCNSCSLLSVCGGGCRANALLRAGSLNAVDPYCYWITHNQPTPVAPSAPVDFASDTIPYISDRLIITKCGSGSAL